jgi:sugar lactone lactonase YvrE
LARAERKEEALLEVYKAEPFILNNAKLGEGVCWDESLGRLLWLDIFDKQLFEYYPDNDRLSSTALPFMMGTIALTNREELLMAGERGIYLFNQGNGKFHRICDPEETIVGHRFNDGKVAPDGRFWAGGVRLEGAEDSLPCAFYRMNTDFSVTKILDAIDISNGLAWNADGTLLYFIDSPRQEIWAFDYDAKNGEISGKRTVAQISPDEGMPDGMTIDTEGMLWVALWRGGCVVRIDPSTGARTARVEVDAPLVSCPAFGGRDMNTLYITSASSTSFGNSLQTRHEGCLFRANTGAKGLPVNRFPLEEKFIANLYWEGTI